MSNPITTEEYRAECQRLESLAIERNKENKDLKRRLFRVTSIFKWLLGYNRFPEREDGDGLFWWREELQEKTEGVGITERHLQASFMSTGDNSFITSDGDYITKVVVCNSEDHVHQNKLPAGFTVPMMATYVFPGAEYWCPYCGHTTGTMSAKTVPATIKLLMVKDAYTELSKEFLKAKGYQVCKTFLFEGERIKPDQLPIKEVHRLQEIVKRWIYGQDVTITFYQESVIA